MQSYYSHSGKIPLVGLITLPAVGTITAAVLGVIYSYAIVYIPFVYLNFFITVGFGLIVGGVVALCAKGTKVRNQSFTLITTFAVMALGYYVAWGADVLARFGMDALPSPIVAWYPKVLTSYIAVFYEEGFWSLKGDMNVSGVFLASVWLIEAGVMAFSAWAAASSLLRESTYCETCDEWSQHRTDLARYSIGDEAALARRLEARDLEALSSRPGVFESSPVYLMLNAHVCSTCDEHCYITVQKVTIKIDDKGEAKTETKAIVDRLGVDGATLKQILATAPKSPEVAGIGPPPEQSIGPPQPAANAAQIGPPRIGSAQVGPPTIAVAERPANRIGPPPGF